MEEVLGIVSAPHLQPGKGTGEAEGMQGRPWAAGTGVGQGSEQKSCPPHLQLQPEGVPVGPGAKHMCCRGF